MSTMTASARAMERPMSITGAVALLLLVVALAVPAVIVTMDGFDAAFVGIAATLATLKLVAAGGLWRCKKWAMFLGFGVTLLDTLLAAGAILDSPGTGGAVLITTVVILGILTLVLLVLPSSRRAYV